MAYVLDERLKAYATPRQWEYLTALVEHGTERRAAKSLGIHHAIIGKAKKAVEKRASQQGYMPQIGWNRPIPEGMRSAGPSIKLDAAGNVMGGWDKLKPAGIAPEDAVRLADPKFISKLSTNFDDQGNVRQQWVSEKPEERERFRLQSEAIAAVAEGLKGDLPVIQRAYRPSGKRAEHLLNLIPMGDPHFGLLCWDKEVGQDFDLTIAEHDLCGAVDYLVSQAPPAERCVIANMGDFFHVDNLDGVTPANKHALDTDSRLGKVIEIGVRALRQAITTGLARHQTVEIINCRANHDPVLGLALNVLFSHVYSDNPRVIVHKQPTFRQYVRHGKTLLGFVHGDKTKDGDLPGIMATERAPDWGETKHRYFWRGHHHKDAKDEYNGCIVEQVRTLAPGDAYANGAGYLSGRDMKLITYHSEYGEQGRSTCGIDLLRSLQ
jgi:hypothetical protein